MAAKCPVCEREFDDVDAVRRHTKEDHGLSAGGKDKQGSWTPVAGPGPAGWYADPWNANFQRFWDGKQWSGKTAAAGTHPVGPSAAEADGAAAAAPVGKPRSLRVVPDPAPAMSGEQLLDQARAADPAHARPAAGAVPGGRAPAGRPSVGRPPPSRQPVYLEDPEDFVLRKPKRRVSPTVAVAGALVAALVLVGGVVILAVGGSNGGGSPNGLPAVNTNPGQTRLATGVAGLADLGLGWTPYPAAHALTPAIYKVGPCGNALWSTDRGGYEDSFINGDKASAAHGAVVSQVREAADAATAAKQQQFVLSPSFIPCLKQTVSQEISSQFLPGSNERVGAITLTPLDVHLPIPSQAFILSAAVVQASGTPGATITDESVQLFSGPYTATIDVSWCSCAPLTQQVVEKVATAVALRIQALPPQGTLSP